ncbi:MAG: YrdB family protein [Chloroflexi bacterium]|nr:YrdB family protein [Chloroflexota bacterium]
MSHHPLNLGLRFALELAALAAMSVWGWRAAQGWPRFLLAVGIPLLAAALWGVFRVPNDPGPAPVAVPGLLRLALELAHFGFAVWALHNANLPTLAWTLAAALIVHYALAYDRVLWLLAQRG